MYCTQCGTRLDDAARFCVSCGKPVNAAPGAVPPPPPPVRLRRIRAEKKIAGVCAGFAAYFAIDVTIMRLIWVAFLLLPPGLGLLAYIVAWIVLPAE